MQEAIPAQRCQWSMLAVITEVITKKYKQRLNKTNSFSFFIILYKKSAINILAAKQSLFLNIIAIFFGTTRNLLAGAKRKEELWLS